MQRKSGLSPRSRFPPWKTTRPNHAAPFSYTHSQEFPTQGSTTHEVPTSVQLLGNGVCMNHGFCVKSGVTEEETNRVMPFFRERQIYPDQVPCTGNAREHHCCKFNHRVEDVKKRVPAARLLIRRHPCVAYSMVMQELNSREHCRC